MSDPTWHPDTTPKPPRPSGMGWVRVILRGGAIIAVLVAGLVVKLGVRLPEWLIHGAGRPWSPGVTQWVCKICLWLLGIRHRTRGTPMAEGGATVANHSSWLDILALNAARRVIFVAKAEVSGWAGIGWLARATGTLFIRRDRREAQAHVAAMAERLALGQQLVFFPEGTSTDGLRVLAFKTTLFAAFDDPRLHDTAHLQAVTIRYTAPAQAEAGFYGWYSTMDLGPHLLAVLAASPQGAVEVVFHTPVSAKQIGNRKALAKHLEAQVRAGLLG